MASSKKCKNSQKRGMGIVKERLVKPKKIINDTSVVVKEKKVSKSIKKSDIQKIIDQKNVEASKIRDFIKKLHITIKLENKKLSEFEGAIIALFELITGEKVED